MMNKRLILTIVTLFVLGGAAGLAIMLTKGYTFSPQERRVVGTGIISVTSLPDGASVYIDGHLTTATNTTISQLTPKNYSIKIVKEGFIPWEKNIEVKEGLVSEIKATLFPALPTIYPLTYNGVVNPLLSPDGQKLAFTVPVVNDSRTRQKGGLYIWTMASAPISFTQGAQLRQAVASVPNFDFTKAQYQWAPDSSQLLLTIQEDDQPGSVNERNYLLATDRQTSVADLRDITPQVEATLKSWEEEKKTRDEAALALIADSEMRKVASEAGVLKWSPDETKFIAGGAKSTPIPTSIKSGQPPKVDIQPTPGPLNGFKVYDLATGKDYALPSASAYYWLPDSKHVILVQEDKVAISEFDGSNVSEIFAGKFEGDEVFPWPDSSRLAIVTSFSTPTASQPNLFGINLK